MTDMSERNYWQRMRRQQLSRRTLLRASAVAGVGAAGLALVGCGDDDDEEEEVIGTETATLTRDTPTHEGSGSPTAGQEVVGAEEEEEAAPAPAPAAVVAAVVAILPAPAANATPPDQVTKGGTYLSASNVGVALQDPHLDQNPGTAASWGEPFAEDLNLTGSPFLNAGQFRGLTVETWEVADEQTLVLNVRRGVPFHDKPPVDGREMQARDIVYTLGSMSGLLYPDRNARRKKGFFGVDLGKGFVATDDYTVQVAFEQPSSVFVPGVLGESRNAILPEGLREAFPGDSLSEAKPERHIGTGAFLPVQYEPTIVYERNPNYWNQPFPYFDRKDAIITGDRATQLAGMISGQLHYMDRVGPEEKKILRGDKGISFIKHWPGSLRHIGWNHRRPGLSDPRVRKALTIAYDQPGIGAALAGNDEDWVHSAPLPFQYAEAISQEELGTRLFFRSPTDADIKQGVDFLDAAGFKDGGLTVAVRTPNLTSASTRFPEQVEHLAAQVEKLYPGNEVKIELQSYTEMLAGIAALDFDGYLGGWSAEADASLMLSVAYASDGSRNFTAYGDPEVDSRLNGALAEVRDVDRRRQLLLEVQEIVIEATPHTWSSNIIGSDAIRPELKDMVWGPTLYNGSFLRYAWLDL